MSQKSVHFYLGSWHLLEEEIHGTSIDKSDKYFIVLFYYFVLKLFSRLLTIFRKTQIVGSGFTKFLQSAAIVEIDVLPGVIFHNRRANSYMTSSVSVPLNILRTSSVSQISFYHCTDLNLVVTCLICKYILRTQSSIYNEAFSQQQSTAKRY